MIGHVETVPRATRPANACVTVAGLACSAQDAMPNVDHMERAMMTVSAHVTRTGRETTAKRVTSAHCTVRTEPLTTKPVLASVTRDGQAQIAAPVYLMGATTMAMLIVRSVVACVRSNGVESAAKSATCHNRIVTTDRSMSHVSASVKTTGKGRCATSVRLESIAVFMGGSLKNFVSVSAHPTAADLCATLVT